jgi:hypothetical protein
LTCANALVVSGWAVSKSGTFAWINTFFTLTSKCSGTLRICQTFIWLASNVWIRVWSVACWAGTDSSMVLCRT